jgi:hypothetical protein
MGLEEFLVVIAGFVVGLQSLFVFAESNEVDWSAGIPLALGSAVGAYYRRQREIPAARLDECCQVYAHNSLMRP